MDCVALSEETTKWFKYYLSNRKFKIHIKNTFSEPLGPLFFLLYINDMPPALDCELLLFADSTCLIF